MSRRVWSWMAVALATVATSGCNAAPGTAPADAGAKLSPDEFLKLIEATGVTVAKDGSYNTELPAELNVKLKLDGEDGFTAQRFPDAKIASDYCQTLKNCVALEVWTLEGFDSRATSPAWAKAKRVKR